MDLSTSDSRFDSFDRKILSILAENGRISLVALAERVGLSKSPCQARVRRLEKLGVIAGYRAVIDPAVLDLQHIAFVEVKLNDTREPALQAFNKAVRALPAVEQCHMMAAGYDYLLKIRTKDIAAYRKVLAEGISNLPHVAQTSTHIAMETVKEPDRL